MPDNHFLLLRHKLPPRHPQFNNFLTQEFQPRLKYFHCKECLLDRAGLQMLIKASAAKKKIGTNGLFLTDWPRPPMFQTWTDAQFFGRPPQFLTLTNASLFFKIPQMCFLFLGMMIAAVEVRASEVGRGWFRFQLCWQQQQQGGVSSMLNADGDCFVWFQPRALFIVEMNMWWRR